jgi:hypothetical protein
MKFLVNVFWFVVTSLIAQALAPRPPAPRPAALDDVQAPTADDGREIPVVFGTVWLNGPNVLWFGDLRTTAIRRRGGKK